MNSAFKILYEIGMKLQQLGNTVYNFLIWEIDLSSIGFGNIAIADILFGALFWAVIGVSVYTYIKRLIV